MEAVKRLFISLIVLLGCTAGAWAIEQDSDGYYLIGSVQDWKRFAELVNSGTNTAANAKMIADVDLGDDQTYISPDWHGEFSNLHYHGTFDGQGHTLTVHYNSDKYFHTPFSQTSGATIKNLHVAGTIKSTSSGPSHMSGLISNSAGNDVIQNVWVSADITGGSHSWIECGAFIGCNNCGNSTITDCLFTGSITTTGGNNGCFAGWVQSYNPSSITTTNCLSTGTFNIGSGSVSRGTLNNCYVKSYPYSIPSAMQVTDEQLADGTIATALQADRSEEIWVQDPVLGYPMLKIFANEETEQPSEALNGEFSITDNGIKVVFSRGNLQYVNDTWQFAKHQYDYFGENQSNGRDMFAFNDFCLPNSDDNWFNMTHDQWVYLLRDRSVTNTLSDGARFTMATLGGTYKGVILFPDNYTHPEGTGFTPGVFNSNSNYTAEVSLEGWALMEAAGCVFLPACGWNSAGSGWKSVGETAVYSSTTVCSDDVTHFYTPCLLFPYKDLEGHVVNLQSRYLGKKKDAPRFQFIQHAQINMFNLGIIKGLKLGEKLYLSEGITDCIALLSSGRKAVAIPSATLLKEEQLNLLAARDLYMYPDNDEAGERMFNDLQVMLGKRGTMVVRLSLPKGCKDFSDYYKKKHQ